MRTETIYYAFDDSEFDNEEECLAYEKEIKDRMNAAVFYDDEKAIVDVEKYGTGSVYYIRIVDAKRAPFLFAWLCDYCGFDYPNDDDYKDGDLFVYDCDHDEWVNLNEQLRWTQSVIDSFKDGRCSDV